MMNPEHPIALGIVSLGLYSAVYFGITTALHVPEAISIIKKVIRVAGTHALNKKG